MDEKMRDAQTNAEQSEFELFRHRLGSIEEWIDNAFEERNETVKKADETAASKVGEALYVEAHELLGEFSICPFVMGYDTQGGFIVEDLEALMLPKNIAFVNRGLFVIQKVRDRKKIHAEYENRYGKIRINALISEHPYCLIQRGNFSEEERSFLRKSIDANYALEIVEQAPLNREQMMAYRNQVHEMYFAKLMGTLDGSSRVIQVPTNNHGRLELSWTGTLRWTNVGTQRLFSGPYAPLKEEVEQAVKAHQ